MCRQLVTPQNAKVSKMVKFGVFHHQRATEHTRQDEIWHVSVDHGSALARQIWPSSVKGGRYRSPPNVKICPKVVVFAHRKPTQSTRSDEIWCVSILHVCTVHAKFGLD